jgi:hypothetical protein
LKTKPLEDFQKLFSERKPQTANIYCKRKNCFQLK